MNILIAGATGFIGKALVSFLKGRGHVLTALVRDVNKAAEQLGTDVKLISFGSTDRELIAEFEDSEVILNLTGRPLAPSRWTKAKKKDFFDSRVGVTKRIVAIMRECENPPSVLVSASATGYYGNRFGEEITESSEKGEGFLADLCDLWEKTAFKAEDFDTRVCALRIGLVLGREGGFLKQLSLPFEMGIGSYIGSGNQWVPWIHYLDLLRIIDLTINDESISGPINCTSPRPVTGKNFAKALAPILGAKILIRLPRLCLRLVFGEGEKVLTSSQKAYPTLLQEKKFQFAHGDLVHALKEECSPTAVSITTVNTQEKYPGNTVENVPELTQAQYKIETSVKLEVSSKQAFEFFSSPLNLGLATPDWMDFHITESSSDMNKGSEFEYKINLGPFPIKWRTEIINWVPDNLFVDYQKKGPYSLWWHQHRIVTEGVSTCRMEDKVFYRVPGWILGRIAHKYIIKNILVRIFAYRRKVIQMRFGGRIYDSSQ
ncbi:MAG: TIGR01777 family oxidoreductase [SAR202 cluster bacterium]|nr:TIGR01777 family oxidoreductase [SAR202 cluster bacterium]